MTGPPAPVARLRHALREFLTERFTGGELAEGDLVLVACSGGGDSLALAAAAAFVTPRLGLRAGAVIVDHRMQSGSAAVAARAQRACRNLGLSPSRVVTAAEVHPPEPGTGPEAQARVLRYQGLEEVRQHEQARAVLLAHTLEDQAETVLLALARGSGNRSLAGMAPVRDTWWRPLLALSGQDTREACTVLELPVWEDPTNAIDGPWRRADGGPLPRAGIRHDVLPALARALGPGVPEALTRSAAMARQDADLLDALATDLADRTIRPEEDCLSADVSELAQAPPALRRRVLLRLARSAGSPTGALGAVHVSELERLITRWHGQGPIHLPGGLEARRECGRLEVRVAPSGRQAQDFTTKHQEK